MLRIFLVRLVRLRGAPVTKKPSLGGSRWLHETTARWRIADAKAKRTEMDRADALSVALYQPHRRGSTDPQDSRLESPLGRFCALPRLPLYPNGLGGHLFNAGVRYREIVLEARQAMGLPNPGWSAGANGYSDGMDDKQILERVQKSRANQDQADATLKRIHLRLPRVMRDVCVLEIEHNQDDSSIMQAGLVALDALFSAGRKAKRPA